MRAAGLLWIVLSTTLAGQLRDNGQHQLERLQDVNRQLYSLEHAKAYAICRDLIDKYPEDPAGFVYLARTYWSEELSNRRALSLERYAAADFFTEDSRYRIPISAELQTNFDRATATAIAKAKARLARDPKDTWSQFLLGLAYQNDASFDASLLHSWWSSFRQGTRAYRLHAALQESHPDIIDVRLVTGVYNYVAGSVPWKVRWLAEILGFHGSTAVGLRDMEAAASRAALVGDDARVILALIYTREKKYDQAFRKLDELHEKYPRNYLVHLDLAGLQLRMGNAAAAVKSYNDILDKVQRRQLGYERLDRSSIYTALGVAARAAGNLDDSVAWLQRSVSDAATPAPALARAHMEFGKTLDLLRRRDDAIAHYKKAQNREAPVHIQREAAALIARPYQR